MTAPRRLQCPSKAPPPSLGTRCGRREREAATNSAREQSPPLFAHETVKGTLVSRMTSPFAGRRLNGGLGRSDTSARVPPSRRSHRRQRVSEGVLGGERRSRVQIQSARTHRKNSVTCVRAVARPSLGPSTRARQSSLFKLRQRKLPGVAHSYWYRGRANSRKREEPAPGLVRVDVARLAACHRSARKLRGASRKGRRSRPPSLRGSKAQVELPARSGSCRS